MSYDGYHHGSHHPDRWDLSTELQRNFIELTNQAERNQAASTVQGSLTQQEVSSGLAQVIANAAVNAAAISVQSQSETNQLSDQATNNANLSSVQATSNFNLGSVQAQTIANLASVQAVQFSMAADVSRQKFAYEGQLQAQTIAAAAAAKAAECCCELKTAIIFDGQKTRDLLNSMKEQDLRDRAQRAESSLAAYFAAKVAPVVP